MGGGFEQASSSAPLKDQRSDIVSDRTGSLGRTVEPGKTNYDRVDGIGGARSKIREGPFAFYVISLASRVRRRISPERAMVPCRATLVALSSTCSNLWDNSATEENSRERPERPGGRMDGLIGKYLSPHALWA